jgi:hypothetical protein
VASTSAMRCSANGLTAVDAGLPKKPVT